MTNAGVLWSLVDALQRQRTPRPGSLVGQTVSVPGRSESFYLAIDSDDHLHFLVSPAASNESRLYRFRRRALQIENRPWTVSGRPTQEYLDFSCLAPTTSALRRPFLSFCEDIVAELARAGTAEDAVYRTCLRWHRFWEEGVGGEVSATWVLGLVGELLFLRGLVSEGGAGAVAAWTGPSGADHDFQAGQEVAIEVKTSTRLPALIECNLEQLDPGLFRSLYLASIVASPVEAGINLPELVLSIEEQLSSSEEALDDFLVRLAAAGYRRDREQEYRQFGYRAEAATYYAVGEGFPRITFGSFRGPLDARIRGVRYQLELSDLPDIREDDPTIKRARRALCTRSA